ncbi:DMT family transporter [Shimia aestuarii]|uniref:DMT family transporter n=1 Tax=Shimia aestuarii TaxID=254406 RepID=UPI001FB2518E|nr:DMT family transporter [Shimia aestuarii]
MHAPEPQQIAQNPALAAALTVTAAAFAAGTTLLAKAIGTGVLGDPLHPLQISQGRFLFAFLAFSIGAMALRPRLTRPALHLHFGRSALGWGGVTLMFGAATFIPLSDATAISFLNPVFAMILAIPFLGEKVGRWRWGSAVLALIGATVLMRPGGASLEFGALLALAAALAMGGEMIFIKLLSGREKPFQILLINNAIGLILASLAASFVWQTPSPAQWAALAGIGLLMGSAQICFVNAMRLADASFVSPFFYLALAFATLYDALVFGVRPDVVSWIGAALILIGAAVLAWRETRKPV